MRWPIGFLALVLGLTGPAAQGDGEVPQIETAIFAGGCFWCMEPPFEKLDGMREVISGYCGGTEVNPSYREVSAGLTGHLESVQVTYDPSRISYSRLLEVFWRQVDPTDEGGQFRDRGKPYRTAIFYLSDEQKRLAEKSRDDLAASGRFEQPIVTMIRPAGEFYRAEEDHQDYYRKHSWRYRQYRALSGRDQFLEKIWGKAEQSR